MTGAKPLSLKSRNGTFLIKDDRFPVHMVFSPEGYFISAHREEPAGYNQVAMVYIASMMYSLNKCELYVPGIGARNGTLEPVAGVLRSKKATFLHLRRNGTLTHKPSGKAISFYQTLFLFKDKKVCEYYSTNLLSE